MAWLIPIAIVCNAALAIVTESFQPNSFFFSSQTWINLWSREGNEIAEPSAGLSVTSSGVNRENKKKTEWNAMPFFFNKLFIVFYFIITRIENLW